MNTKVLLIAVVGTLLLPVLPLLAGLIAGLGEWPSHALPRTAVRPAAEEDPADPVAA
jgi:hypothetical protein